MSVLGIRSGRGTTTGITDDRAMSVFVPRRTRAEGAASGREAGAAPSNENTARSANMTHRYVRFLSTLISSVRPSVSSGISCYRGSILRLRPRVGDPVAPRQGPYDCCSHLLRIHLRAYSIRSGCQRPSLHLRLDTSSGQRDMRGFLPSRTQESHPPGIATRRWFRLPESRMDGSGRSRSVRSLAPRPPRLPRERSKPDIPQRGVSD